MLTKAHVSKLCKVFEKNCSTNINLSKDQLHKIGQSGRFLSRILGPLLKTGFALMKNVLKSLAKSVLIPLELTAAITATSAAGFGITVLIILNEEMNDILELVKSLEASGLLIKGVSEPVENEAKQEKGGFLSMLLSTLRAILLGNLLRRKDTIRAVEGKIKASQDF